MTKKIDLKPKNIRPLTDAEAALHAKGYVDGLSSNEKASDDPIYLDGYNVGRSELLAEMKQENIDE